jgi:adenosylhomocysteine nucleosidase
MKIGIITAMPEETAAVLKKAGCSAKNELKGRKIFHCDISGHKIVLIEAGMGMLNAGWAATVLAVEQSDLIISTGFGGAVLPGLSVGDIVAAQQLLHSSASGFEEIEVGIYGRNSIADSLGFNRGTFISCDAILDKKTLVKQLPDHVSNPVLEMESAAVARVAETQGIPFLGIRAISDPWDEELDFSINEFCDENMKIRIPKVLATIAKRPKIIPQLIRLARTSSVAAKSLAVAMERLLNKI